MTSLREAMIPYWVRRLGWKCLSLADPFARRSYSQEAEDLILERMFEDQTTGFYVDVGAYHPVRFSNTLLFYERGWNGINIDASDTAIALFRKARPRDINVVAGISDESGDTTFFEFNEPALNTLDADIAAKRMLLPGYRLIAKESIRLYTLAQILERLLPDGRTIDFLSVDAEGHDFQVLRSNDWIRFRPKVVLVEALECSLRDLASWPPGHFLEDHGYTPFAKTFNTAIYVDQQRAPSIAATATQRRSGVTGSHGS